MASIMIMGRTFPKGSQTLETQGYIFVCSDFSGNKPSLPVLKYDKKFGTWEKAWVNKGSAKKLWTSYIKAGMPDIDNLRHEDYANMMKHSRRHKRGTGSKDRPYTITDQLVHRGFTDESHWAGMVGSMVAYNI